MSINLSHLQFPQIQISSSPELLVVSVHISLKPDRNLFSPSQPVHLPAQTEGQKLLK